MSFIRLFAVNSSIIKCGKKIVYKLIFESEWNRKSFIIYKLRKVCDHSTEGMGIVQKKKCYVKKMPFRRIPQSCAISALLLFSWYHSFYDRNLVHRPKYFVVLIVNYKYNHFIF